MFHFPYRLFFKSHIYDILSPSFSTHKSYFSLLKEPRLFQALKQQVLEVSIHTPCSGKTTYAKTLAIEEKALLLTPDTWRNKRYSSFWQTTILKLFILPTIYLLSYV